MLSAFFYQSAEDVPDPRELSSEKKNLMVFDDLLLEKQNRRYNSINSLLGFHSKLYTSGSNQPEHMVNILTITYQEHTRQY